jgi:hypothetical protein
MSVILAIDPGSTQSAFVVYDGKEELIKDKGIVPNGAMFEVIGRWKAEIRCLACEMIASYGMPVGASVFETCICIGEYKRECDIQGISFHKVYRKDVKMYLCGSVKAKDSNIHQALVDRFGAPGKKSCPGKTYGISKDMWAALGVAVTMTAELLPF